MTDDNIKDLWSSSKVQRQLRKVNMELQDASPEVKEILATEEASTPTYEELAAVPAAEWSRLYPERSVQVVEGSEGDIPSTEINAVRNALQEAIEEQRIELQARVPLTLNSEIQTISELQLEVLPNTQSPLLLETEL